MDGYVYIFRDRLNNNLIKVGFSIHPIARLKQLHTTGTPLPFFLAHAWWVADMRAAEKIAHVRLQDHRINTRREFFFIAPPNDFSEFEQNDYDITCVFLDALIELIEIDFDNYKINYAEVDLEKYWEAYTKGDLN
jgi:hypothetical protein